MIDIVNIFPTAAEVKENGKDSYSLYLFEEELKSILRLICWAVCKGYKRIQVSELSGEAKEFLLEKGYNINADDKNWWIEWGE